jgi:beta-lactamase class A
VALFRLATLAALLAAIGCHGADPGTEAPTGVDAGTGGDGAPSDGGASADAALPFVDPAPLIAELGPALEAATGGDVAIAVLDLATGAGASYAGSELHISASSAKAFWTAAALDAVGVEPVEPHAVPTFTTSDNFAAGEIIDLVGPNEVNVFLWEQAGMDDTALTTWSFGKERIATNSPRRLGGNNYLTADDSVRFLELLWSGALLGPDETAALLAWMQLSPRDGFGGWAGTLLPEPARAGVRHKAGWLPPDCCSQPFHTLVDIGIVDTGERSYAYALLFRFGDWDIEQLEMSRASCEIYRLISREPGLSCE